MKPRQFSGSRLARGGILALLLLVASMGFATEEALEKELRRLGALSSGMMGVAAVHLESGRSAFLNADEPFPMASTFKVPIAVELLRLVDERQPVHGRLVIHAKAAEGAAGLVQQPFLLVIPNGLDADARPVREFADGEPLELMFRDHSTFDCESVGCYGVNGLRTTACVRTLLSPAHLEQP